LPAIALESRFWGSDGAAAANPVNASATASPTPIVSHLDLDTTFPLPSPHTF
jgi:hypothetical protein